jgi:hypothetical protein
VAPPKGAVDAAQTNLSLVKRNLTYTVVTAPMAVYFERLADIGEQYLRSRKHYR